MVPLSWEATETVVHWEDGSHRTLSLHHALMHRRPGLWGDHARYPQSVVLLRRGSEGWEAFGAGNPEPAVLWLARRRAPVALLAPEGWDQTVRAIVSPFTRSVVHVRFLPEPHGEPILPSQIGPPILTRRLNLADAPAFTASAPDWAWKSWGSPEECLGRGAAVGVFQGAVILAVAWIVELDRHFDAIGVFTRPHFRRLGLGRAVAAGLIHHIVTRRKKCPLWAAAAENEASLRLATSLGLTLCLDETILRFGRGVLADDPGPS